MTARCAKASDKVVTQISNLPYRRVLTCTAPGRPDAEPIANLRCEVGCNGSGLAASCDGRPGLR
jgi:hypothetical protein